MATETAGVPVTTPADVGLKREMGLIGATWASETSIIGSGWLFGALFAAQAAGPRPCWAGSSPASSSSSSPWCTPNWAGCTRSQAARRGSRTSPSAASPVSRSASSPGCRRSRWRRSSASRSCSTARTTGRPVQPDTRNVTGLGFVLTIVLMAIFTAINFLAMRLFSRVNCGITWWKVAIPVLAIIVLLFKFHTATSPAGGGFMPFGIKALFTAIPGRHRVRLPGLRAGRPAGGRDQGPAAEPAPGHHPRGADRHRHLLPAAGRVHRRDTAQPVSAHGLGRASLPQAPSPSGRSLAWRAGRARLAGDHPADRRVHLAVRHRPDLPDLHLAGRLRPGQEPVLPADLPKTTRTACPGSA